MIYLIFKIFGYLLVALSTGFASGWLFRNLMAAKKEEEMQTSLNDSRSKLPQFESLLRGRDQQIIGLKEDLNSKEKILLELTDDSRATDKELQKTTQKLKRLTKQGVDDGDLLADADIGSDGGGKADEKTASEIEVLNARITSLTEELERSATPQPPETNADAGRNARLVQELEARVRQQAHESERLGKSLEQERRKLVELERERDLQHKSLQVLHQQLEIKRGENGHRANG